LSTFTCASDHLASDIYKLIFILIELGFPVSLSPS